MADAQERVATALEALCSLYGIRTAPLDPVEEIGEADVDYASDEATAIREAEEELVRLGYRPPQDPT